MEKNAVADIKNFDIPNPFRIRIIYDFELCVGVDELKETIREINQRGYSLIGVTQHEETYTVFFRRNTV